MAQGINPQQHVPEQKKLQAISKGRLQKTLKTFIKTALLLTVVGLLAFVGAFYAAGWPFWIAMVSAWVTQGLVALLFYEGAKAPPLEMHESTWYDDEEELQEKR